MELIIYDKLCSGLDKFVTQDPYTLVFCELSYWNINIF